MESEKKCTKKCKSCGEMKVYSHDSSDSEFYQIKNTNNFRGTCKVCYRINQKVKDTYNRKVIKWNTPIFFIEDIKKTNGPGYQCRREIESYEEAF